MAKPKIIAFDLDGTVLLPDHMTVSERTYNALSLAEREGSILTPVTGRAESIIPLEKFPPVRYVVSSNGGMISDRETGKILRVLHIDREHVLKAWRAVKPVIRGHGATMELFENGAIVIEREVADNPDKYADILPAFHISYIKRGKAKVVSTFDDYLENEGAEVVKINFPGRCYERCQEIGPILKEMNVFTTTSDGLNFELTAKGGCKGDALSWLCDYLGVPLSDAAAFGDGDNDVSMLSCAGWGVAMGNAVESVRKAARYVTLSNSEDGIAAFLEANF